VVGWPESASLNDLFEADSSMKWGSKKPYSQGQKGPKNVFLGTFFGS
jgi:hypothetical protein